MKIRTSMVLAACIVSLPAHAQFESYFNEPIITSTTSGLQVGLRPLDIGDKPEYDYLVQQVCVDAQDRPIPKDPLTCPSSRRKLRIGEDLPYTRVSIKPSNGARVETMNSIPMMWHGGVRFLNAHTWTPSSAGPSKYRHYTDFTIPNVIAGDGYDVIDNRNGYTFIVGTRDGTTQSANWIWCGYTSGGGWVLFFDGATGYGSSILPIGGGEIQNCQANGLSLTEWAPRTFKTMGNKSLSAMKSVHYSGPNFASANIANDHLEIFYTTKVYGMVSWERWERDPNKVPKKNGEPVYPTECRGENEHYRGDIYKYYRTDCHDYSEIILHDRPLHPYYVPLTTTFTTSPNLLANSDFSSENASEWSAVMNGEATYRVTNSGTDRNWRLVIDKVANTKTSSLYQDAYPPYVYARAMIQGGALMKGPPNKRAVIEVLITDRQETSAKIRFKFPNEGWTPIRFSIPYDFDKSQGAPSPRLRFRVYAQDVGTSELDEPFLAILPRSLGTL